MAEIKLLDVKELAIFLHKSVHTVRSSYKKWGVPVVDIPESSSLLFNLEDVENWIRSKSSVKNKKLDRVNKKCQYTNKVMIPTSVIFPSTEKELDAQLKQAINNKRKNLKQT